MLTPPPSQTPELWELDLCCLSCTVYGIFIIEAWIDQDTWQIPEGGLGAEEDSGGESSWGNWVFKDKTEEVASACLCCSRKPGKTSLLDHRLLHWTRASRVEPYTGLERRKFLRIPHLLESPRMGRHWTFLQTSIKCEWKTFLPMSHPGPPSSMHVHSSLVTPHAHTFFLIILIF